MNGLIMIGRDNKENGPSGVIKSIKKVCEDSDLPIEFITVNEFKQKKTIVGLIKRLLSEREKVICVHQDGYILPLVVMMISKLNPNCKFYCIIHGIYFIEAQYANNVSNKYVRLEKILIHRFPNLICVSHKLKEDIAREFKRVDKIIVINNGTETGERIQSITDLRKGIRFVMVGGIKDRKGIIESVELINYLVHNKKLKVKLSIYGAIDNPQIEEEFHTKVQKYNLQDNIHYYGIIKDRSILFLKYQQANFQLCLSKYDTFNIAVLESMSVGCPAILSSNCGVHYLLDDFSGIKVDMDNPEYIDEISNRLIQLMNSESLYNKMCKKAIEVANAHKWNDVVYEYLNLLKIPS